MLGVHDPRRIMEIISVRILCIEEHFEELNGFFKYKLIVQDQITKKKNTIKNSSQYLGPLGNIFHSLNVTEKDILFDLKELESLAIQCKKDIENQIKEIKKLEAIFVKLWKKLPDDKIIIDDLLKKAELQQELDKKQKKMLLLWEEWTKNIKRCLEVLESIETKRCTVLKDVFLKYCNVIQDQLNPVLSNLSSNIALLEGYTFQQDIDQLVGGDYDKLDRLMSSRKSFRSKQIAEGSEKGTVGTLSRTSTQVDEEGFTVREETEKEANQQIEEEDGEVKLEPEKQTIKVKIVDKVEPLQDDFSDIKISEIPTNTMRRRNPSALQNQVQHKPSLQIVQQPIAGAVLINEKINVLFTQDGFDKSFITGEIVSNGPLTDNVPVTITGLSPLGNIHYNPLYLSEINKNLKYLVKGNVSDKTALLKYQIEPLTKDTTWAPFFVESVWKFESSIKCILTIIKNSKMRRQLISTKASVFLNANQPIEQHKTSIPSILIGDAILKMDFNMEEDELRILIQLNCKEKKEIGIALQFELDGLMSDLQVEKLTTEVKCSSGKYVQIINKHLA